MRVPFILLLFLLVVPGVMACFQPNVCTIGAPFACAYPQFMDMNMTEEKLILTIYITKVSSPDIAVQMPHCKQQSVELNGDTAAVTLDCDYAEDQFRGGPSLFPYLSACPGGYHFFTSFTVTSNVTASGRIKTYGIPPPRSLRGLHLHAAIIRILAFAIPILVLGALVTGITYVFRRGKLRGQ